MSLFGNKESKDSSTKVEYAHKPAATYYDSSRSVSSSTDTTFLAKNTSLAGDLESTGDITMDGKLEGNIHCGGKFVMGQTAVVEGNVFAQHAEISGEITGKVEIKELLTLKSTAIIHGDINTGKLVIEAGAKFNGNCKMGVVSKEVPLSEKSAKSANN